MKILLLGKNGQVGWELQRTLALLGEVVALDRNGTSSFCGNLENLEGVAQTIRAIAPDVIVNAAAYTAVDKAEKEQALAALINAEAPGILAREARALGALLVHYSTDYVFDGSGDKPWRETDVVAPLNYYGKTKLEGERAIQLSGCKHLIFRTSWVYGIKGSNFIRTIIKLAEQREILNIIDDQVGAPTGAELLADVTAYTIREALLRPDVACGLYHLCPQGETSWFNYASFIVAQLRELKYSLAFKDLLPISSADYATVASRPLNSRLNTAKLSKIFSIQLPCWEDGVTRIIKNGPFRACCNVL